MPPSDGNNLLCMWSISEKMVQQVGPELCRNRDEIYTNSTGKEIKSQTGKLRIARSV